MVSDPNDVGRLPERAGVLCRVGEAVSTGVVGLEFLWLSVDEVRLPNFQLCSDGGGGPAACADCCCCESVSFIDSVSACFKVSTSIESSEWPC